MAQNVSERIVGTKGLLDSDLAARRAPQSIPTCRSTSTW